MDKTGLSELSPIAEANLKHQILLESLEFLFRSMPSALAGHSLASFFVVFALKNVVDRTVLFTWSACIIIIVFIRFIASGYFQLEIARLSKEAVRNWTRFLAFLTLVQTGVWGSSVFFIWPEDMAHRAILVVTLAGIIAAGGILLALHKRSFWIYCLPIAIPLVFQLLMSGGELDLVLAGLITIYSGVLLVSVNRLTKLFLDSSRLRASMQNESRTDSLTGLANRRGFDEYLQDLWQQSIRSSQTIGLLSIDVDHFKKYNDQYGHPQGDRALQRVAETLLSIASRSTDSCARIGGEEFAVLMPATEVDGSEQVALAIKDAFARANIPHKASRPGFLTVSIGLNVMTPDRNSSLQDFLADTDQALYLAKDAGRNSIKTALKMEFP
jgi:diguanylate cyclase (GGDEF)-like protein